MLRHLLINIIYKDDVTQTAINGKLIILMKFIAALISVSVQNLKL